MLERKQGFINETLGRSHIGLTRILAERDCRNLSGTGVDLWMFDEYGLLRKCGPKIQNISFVSFGELAVFVYSFPSSTGP